MVLLIAIIVGVIGWIMHHKGGGTGGAPNTEAEGGLRFFGQLLIVLAVVIIGVVSLWYPEHLW